jgi:hypothetical protein
MKSKIAMRLLDGLVTNYVGNGATHEECAWFCDVVKQFGRIAEQDARDRAIKSIFISFGNHCTEYEPICPKECNPAECPRVRAFLRVYDNEM